MVKHNGTASEEVPLAYANKTSTFEGTLNLTKDGTYEVTVYAFDPLTGNSGVDKTVFLVTQ